MQAEEPAPVALLIPAHMVINAVPLQRAWFLHCSSQPALQFALEPGDTSFRDDVLHTRVLAILAVSVVALAGFGGFSDLDNLLNRRVAQRQSQMRIGLSLAVR